MDAVWNVKDPIAEPVDLFGSPVKNRNGGIIIWLAGFSNQLLQLFFKGEKDSRIYMQLKSMHGFYGTVVDVLYSVLKFVPKVEGISVRRGI